MYREDTGPVLEDVLLSDQFLYEYSPADSIINFELPSALSSENNDWLSDVDFNCDAFVSDLSDNKEDFNFTECSPVSFDFAALDKNIDEYLLEALSNDRSNDTPQSCTDSTDSCVDALGTFTVLNTQLDSMCVQDVHNYSKKSAWKTRIDERKPESKVRSWEELSFCSELGAFRCPVENCGKLYAKRSHVRAHLRRHSGEKPYRCTWGECAWRFARSDELARHRRSHSGDKPYGCGECGKRFARSDHLAKHGRVHARRAAVAAAAAAKRSSSTHYHRTRRLL